MVMRKAEIVLSNHELSVAGQVGFRRNLEATLNGRQARFKERVPGELWGFHIHSAMAELAVAKYLGRYWSFHENHFESGDVGKLEIRFSNRADCKVRKRDDGVVVSVSGGVTKFILNGWIEASEAKRDAWVHSPRPEAPPAYFVPHPYLNDMESLISISGEN